ncbi:HDOD domain-containing protein [Azoarcus indigens]|uniref:Response regulator receiver domain-containing protein n=1 Tax=Azoarcus indigens TaxID=29545 RepID=A0A4R6DTE3_9RHOO|nr:HDOD domain-containing protein [Azoarcus indigens]NMG64473.1 HDOD domain-containing protein [Azoarcus indigens]TDN48411.1 response regulator receiver domain-containing protein [Azoarcus indigens]
MRVVFVDDEPLVLSGFERTLAIREDEWDCAFFTSGPEALAGLESCPADVIVSDMRMPFMDGAELLQQVRARWPASMRIILSGHADVEAMRRMLDVAHQFLAKPCDNARLFSIIESAVRLRDMFSAPEVVAAVGGINRLPSAPRIFGELNRMLADPLGNTRAVGELISADPALSAKVLQLSNSAFFGGGKPVPDVAAAVARLGTEVVTRVVIAAQVFDGASANGQVDALQRQALRASQIAARVIGTPGPAATAALLAHVGLLVAPVPAATAAPESCCVCGAPLHAAVGAYLLGLWGLPMDIVRAVAHHHLPQCDSPTEFGITGMTHVATALASGEQPDGAYLAAAGMLDRLPAWQAASSKFLEEENDE